LLGGSPSAQRKEAISKLAELPFDAEAFPFAFLRLTPRPPRPRPPDDSAGLGNRAGFPMVTLIHSDHRKLFVSAI
jgi:hypothetical protein